MEIPEESLIKNDHFTRSVKFDFSKDNLQQYFRTLCSKCEDNDKIYKYNEEYNYIEISHDYPRSEVATFRILKDRNVQISWRLKLDHPGDEIETTVSQIIGWQDSCFDGGNYHIRKNGDYWQVWIRNLGNSTRDILLNKEIVYGEWVRFNVIANFSYTDGNFLLSIKDSESFEVYDLIKHGQSYVNCDLGPYLKFGSYSSDSSNLKVSISQISINYQN